MHDVVVIGGGHNGLVCSAYLAMAGFKVVVLDQRSVVGGAAVTEEFSPGFSNSVASYAVSLLNPKIRNRHIDELGTILRYLAPMIKTPNSLYRGHRFPAEVIAHAVWLYFRFPLSLRMVEDLLAARGVIVSHETVRRWAEKFGRDFANKIRRRASRFGDKWHLDEVAVTINGKKHWLWRAVDQEGFVLDALVQSRRDKRAAERLLRKLIRKQARTPRVMITDKLGSYGAARRRMRMTFEHRQHKGLNNRAENSHLPTRRRERIMKRFKSARHLQRFLSIHDPIANLHHFPRHSLSSADYRSLRSGAMNAWREIAELRVVA